MKILLKTRITRRYTNSLFQTWETYVLNGLEYPLISGVYRIIYNDSSFYIGKSICIFSRWKNHLLNASRYYEGKGGSSNELRILQAYLDAEEVILEFMSDKIEDEAKIIKKLAAPNCLNHQYNKFNSMWDRRRANELNYQKI